jgi:hypothetical protein
MPLLEDLYRQQRAREVEFDPFNYSVQFTDLEAGGTVPGSTSIQADSAFVLRYLQLVAFTNCATFLAAPNLRMSLFDTGSGRNLQDQATHVLAITGGRGDDYANQPFIFAEPKLFSASATIQTTLTNLSNATIGQIDVVFHGFKVFKFRGGQ